MQALNPYFLVKVPKIEEINKREKLGNLYLHPSFVWMTRNTQCGIIESISPEAHNQLPEAKEGDILIIHHFSQGSHSVLERDKRYLAYEDEEYNYYNVTSKEIPGINNQCYGVFDGEKIIPHKEYIFLQPAKEPESPYGYKETTEDKLEKIQDLKNEIEYLGKGRQSVDKINYMTRQQNEMSKLSASLHKKEYKKYTVCYSNPSFNINNKTVLALNIACGTVVNFEGVDYNVALSKYISAII